MVIGNISKPIKLSLIIFAGDAITERKVSYPERKMAGCPAQCAEPRNYSGKTVIRCLSIYDFANNIWANRNMSAAFLFRSFPRLSTSITIGTRDRTVGT
jgi:hypothetical protein